MDTARLETSPREGESRCAGHTLRRSQVALLIAQGEHPKISADRLGHTSVRTVLDVYGHLCEGADEAAAERLEKSIVSASRREVSRDTRAR